MEYLDVKGVAKYLVASKETIYRWVKTGYIPVHTVGKKHLFCKEEIDLWVLSHKGKRRVESYGLEY